MASDSAGDFSNAGNAETLNLNSTELYSSALSSSVPTPSLKPPFSLSQSLNQTESPKPTSSSTSTACPPIPPPSLSSCHTSTPTTTPASPLPGPEESSSIRSKKSLKENEKKVLFLVATYVVGKEKILIEIAKRCKRKIFVDARKMSILNVLECGESGMFTEDKSESDVHVVGWNLLGETWPYFRPNFAKMNEVMVERGYDKVVGFVHTGWTYEVKRNKLCTISYWLHLPIDHIQIPCLFLRCFLDFLNPS
ncbi:hypothetical protein F2Q69_00013159 [Brassica cretica]|uniref:Uncharacterized protein n=1 Tax=Brassica cretica TaxID=69181 RepID=A0A8S9QXR3_BRACR|nr:hypothetical protein F2Q69_00013159 [Brassica cretica]